MESAFRECTYTDKMMESAYHEAAKKMQLSDSEFSILYIFSNYPDGCKQSALYKEAYLSKSTVNSAIRKMEQKELLYLTPGDGRNTMVFLTEKGKELMEKTVYPIIQIENDIYNSWTKKEQELFLRLNRDFAERLLDEVRKL